MNNLENVFQIDFLDALEYKDVWEHFKVGMQAFRLRYYE